MKVVVITGTAQKGITYFMKEEILKYLRNGNEITEFYPKDLPTYCLGCKNCFMNGESKCPHFSQVGPVWQAIMEADLLVFAYPIYALRTPGVIKSLLDHLCVHWVVHRPEKEMFKKSAIIITNSVGAPNGAAQRDVKTSLNWMGVSNVYTCGMGMMGDIFIDKLSTKHRSTIEKKMKKLATKAKKIRPRKHMSLKVKMIFSMATMLHKMTLKGEEVPSLDNQHYIDNGWIKIKGK